MRNICRFYKISVLIYFSIFNSISVYCQDSLNVNSDNRLFELNLDSISFNVITASKQLQTINDVTQKIDIIESRSIETVVCGNTNACEIISKLPGMSVSVLSRNDANWGTYSGIGPKYSTYMVNGLPIDAFIDPMSLDVNAIGRIEVQRGQASVVYPNYLSQDFAGNQSPLAGTVNFVLKEKINQTKTIVKSSAGSYNTNNEQFYHQNQKGLLHYFCGLTYENSEYTNYGVDNSWLNIKVNPEYKKTKLYAGVTLFTDKSENQKISLFFQNTNHNGNVGRLYRGFENNYQTVNTGYSFQLLSNVLFQTHFGVRSYSRDWQESVFGIIDTLKSENSVKQYIIPADISLSWNQKDIGVLNIGFDYQNATYENSVDNLTGNVFIATKADALQYCGYIQEEIVLFNKLKFRSGLRYSLIKNRVDLVSGKLPGEGRGIWKKPLWSVGLKYNANDKIFLYTNSGTSFSVPSIKSSSGTISIDDIGVIGKNGQLPNIGLKPETGFTFDLGVDVVNINNLSFGLRLFYITLKDAIVDNIVSYNPSQTQSVNAGFAESKGMEIDIKHKINMTFLWFINSTLINSNLINEIDNNQTNVEIPFAPSIVVNSGMQYYSKNGFSFVPYVNYNGGYFEGTSRAINGRQKIIPGFLLNACMSKKMVQNNSYTVDLFAQLYNILNNKYTLPWQFQNTGFSCMLGLKLALR